MEANIYVLVVMLVTLIVGVEIAYAMAHHPRTRAFGYITMFGIVAFPVAVLFHNIASALIGGEEAVSFILGVLIAPAAITLGTLGVASVLHTDAPGVATGFALAGIGLAIFPAFILAALVVSVIAAPLPENDVLTEVLLPLSLVAVTSGALWTSFALATAQSRSDATV